jgi:hypothetical protein
VPANFRWCGKGGFADRKCTLDDTLPKWFDERFPPLSIYYGGRDYLVWADPLLDRLKEKEKDVKVIKVTKLDQSEVSKCLYLANRSTATFTGRQRLWSGLMSRSRVSFAYLISSHPVQMI